MKKNYFTRTIFWDKVADTFAMVGGIATGGIGGIDLYLAGTQISPVFLLITGGFTVGGMLVKMWMTDDNKDGKVDFLEDD